MNNNHLPPRNPLLLLGCTFLAVATLLLEQQAPRRGQVTRMNPKNRRRNNHLKLVASNGRVLNPAPALHLVT